MTFHSGFSGFWVWESYSCSQIFIKLSKIKQICEFCSGQLKHLKKTHVRNTGACHSQVSETPMNSSLGRSHKVLSDRSIPSFCESVQKTTTSSSSSPPALSINNEIHTEGWGTSKAPSSLWQWRVWCCILLLEKENPTTNPELYLKYNYKVSLVCMTVDFTRLWPQSIIDMVPVDINDLVLLDDINQLSNSCL